MSVVCHNVWVGQSRTSARANLARLVGEHKPDAFLLQEAKRLDGPLVDGYLNYAGTHQFGGDHDNCRILIRRDGFEVLASGAWKVPGPAWAWNGNEKPTRVFPWLVARRRSDDHVFILVSVHRIPGGPVPGIPGNRAPWGNEHTSLVSLARNLREQWPDATVILGGDWNARADDRPEHRHSLASLARDLGGAHVAVRHIDGLIVLGGQTQGVRKLDDKYGSDGHKPVVGQVIPT